MIIKTITDNYYLWDWLKDSSYANKFSLEGAKALFEWYADLSDEVETNIEFDPIAWCCAWSEYDSVDQAVQEVFSSEADWNIESLEEHTEIIKLDNNHILVMELNS